MSYAEHFIARLRVSIAIDVLQQADAEIAALRAALAECAECLAERVDQGYHQRKQYPDMQRRYERDMEPVARARALLEKPNGK